MTASMFDAKTMVELPYSESSEIKYNFQDVLLYNLGVGCTDLQFMHEKHPNFSVFPTFPIRFAGSGAWERFPRTTPGLNIDGERYMELLAPLPVPKSRKDTVSVFASAKVCGLHDKKTGVVHKKTSKQSDSSYSSSDSSSYAGSLYSSEYYCCAFFFTFSILVSYDSWY